MSEEDEHDWYAILGCDPDSSKAAIEKAARKLSLKYHPDKTDDAKAGELFLLVHKAKDILLDDEKRKIIDEKRKQTQKRKEYDEQRNKYMDSRRKRMREELDQKMKEHISSATASDAQLKEQEHLRRRDSANIDRLRKEGASLRESTAKEADERIKQRMREFLKQRMEMEKSNSANDSSQRQVKIKWKRTRHNHSDDSLFMLFKIYGDIEDVSLVGSKGNAALLTFAEASSARKAIDDYATSEEYRVTSLINDSDGTDGAKTKAAVFTHEYTTSQSGKDQSGVLYEKVGAHHVRKDGESDLLREMRRAVEREELLRSLGEPPGGEAIDGRGTSNGANSATAPPSAGSSTQFTTSIGAKNEKPSFAPTGTNDAATTSSSSRAPASKASVASKEADILKRMMEAALLKKSKTS